MVGSNPERNVQKTNATHDESYDEVLQNVRSAATISMSPELFEKLYLAPQNSVKGDLRRTFANPTPL